jgi:hypothetical protein
MSKITTHQRKALIEKISQLNETEHYEIFKLLEDTINREQVSFTHNRNGLFLDFKLVPNDVFYKIEQFVNFCLSNRQDLDNYDKCINECKLNKDISKVVSLHHSYQEDAEHECDNLDNNLNSVIARENKQHEYQQQWLNILQENKKNYKLSTYLESLDSLYSKIHKKKTCNMKYANAKKKFARKILSIDRKSDSDLISDLNTEYFD